MDQNHRYLRYLVGVCLFSTLSFLNRLRFFQISGQEELDQLMHFLISQLNYRVRIATSRFCHCQDIVIHPTDRGHLHARRLFRLWRRHSGNPLLPAILLFWNVCAVVKTGLTIYLISQQISVFPEIIQKLKVMGLQTTPSYFSFIDFYGN